MKVSFQSVLIGLGLGIVDKFCWVNFGRECLRLTYLSSPGDFEDFCWLRMKFNEDYGGNGWNCKGDFGLFEVWMMIILIIKQNKLVTINLT